MNTPFASTSVGTKSASVDAGLQAYMNTIYKTMAGAVLLTAVISYLFGMDLVALQAGESTFLPSGLVMSLLSAPMIYVIMFAPLVLILAAGFLVKDASARTINTMTTVISILMGLSMSVIFVRYTQMSIAQVFFATSAMFAGLSLWGYTTGKDLSGWGKFLFMGLIGIIVVSIVNIFVGSSALQFAVSSIAVLVFSGLIAYETQSLKTAYISGRNHLSDEEINRIAAWGALSLYLDFVNLFMALLQLFGQDE